MAEQPLPPRTMKAAIHITRELHWRVKAQAVHDRMSISDWCEQLLSSVLDEIESNEAVRHP